MKKIIPFVIVSLVVFSCQEDDDDLFYEDYLSTSKFVEEVYSEGFQEEIIMMKDSLNISLPYSNEGVPPDRDREHWKQ